MKDFGKKEAIDENSDISEIKPTKDNIFDVSKYEDEDDRGRSMPILYAPFGMAKLYQPNRKTAPLHFISSARERAQNEEEQD